MGGSVKALPRRPCRTGPSVRCSTIARIAPPRRAGRACRENGDRGRVQPHHDLGGVHRSATARWGLLELIVETLGGDTERFHDLWLRRAGLPTPAPAAAKDLAPAASATRRPPQRRARRRSSRQRARSRRGSCGRRGRFTDGSSNWPSWMSCSTRGPRRDHRGGVGHSGRGKTALAVHWAHRVGSGSPMAALRELRGYDPDKPLGPDEALEAFCASWASTGRRSHPKWRSGPPANRSLLADGTCSCCSTTPTPSTRSATCCPARRRASCWSPAGHPSGLVAPLRRTPGRPRPAAIADGRRCSAALIGRRVNADRMRRGVGASGAPGCPSRCASRPKLATSRPSATLAELVAGARRAEGTSGPVRAGDDGLHRGAGRLLLVPTPAR